MPKNDIQHLKIQEIKLYPQFQIIMGMTVCLQKMNGLDWLSQGRTTRIKIQTCGFP